MSIALESHAGVYGIVADLHELMVPRHIMRPFFLAAITIVYVQGAPKK